MKINKEDEIYGGKWEKTWIKYKKVANFFVRYFEIRAELSTGAGIGLLFSEKYFKTYNFVPDDFLEILKKIEKGVKEDEDKGVTL